ncbi:MAG: tRNA uridine-5-carboxymethylaminomethyl(34) synthesis GTPase MnmE [Rhodocyclaceae bacterium]
MRVPRGNRNDVIAAIATAQGRGGIGVVRLSGCSLARFTREIAGKNLLPRTATLTDFLGGDGQAIDRGIAIFFPSPHSFTGEEILELQGHGGPVVMRMLLTRCVELGARIAEPGEFTRRAFLNDKLDLAQAESVADLIDASTTAAARSAMRSLAGAFSQEIHSLVSALTELRMLVEGSLDLPEEGIDFLAEAHIPTKLAALGERIETIRVRARSGRLLRSGIHVVLAGRPNVGKSSLLNCLAGEDRAIVTAVPGTTRDAVRESIDIDGVPLHVIDTAGLRETDDHVEGIGIERTWHEIEKADVVVLVTDGSAGITPDDEEILGRLPAGIPGVTVVNKIDLVGDAPGVTSGETGSVVRVSAKFEQGIELLRAELLRLSGWCAGAGEDVFCARERHLEALGVAAAHLGVAAVLGEQLDLLAEELRLAQKALGGITGEMTSDDLLGEIFGRFCVGK